MSRKLDPGEYHVEFNVGDTVCFDYEGQQLTGEIVREVFGDNHDFHVEVKGERYDVTRYDNMKLVARKGRYLGSD